MDLNFPKKLALGAAGATVVALPIVVGVLNAPSIRAQTAPIPKFEVASIKPCKDDDNRKSVGRRGGSGGDSSPGRLSTGCWALNDENNLGLIQHAYVRFAGGHANPFHVVPIEGGPKWIRTELFDINAKAEGTPSLEMMEGPMMQALLEDRFQLKIRREIREVPVYEITVAKGGPKLKTFEEGSCVGMPLTAPLPVPKLPPGQRYCLVMVGPRRIIAEGATLDQFSKLLNLALDRPTVDKTGLTGRLSIHIEFAPDEATPRLLRSPAGSPPAAVTDDPAGGPSIFTAMQEQLGLKLVPAKGPAEFLVIDHIERPSEN
jgi:uncharacterized protein (TIGR03435 family)